MKGRAKGYDRGRGAAARGAAVMDSETMRAINRLEEREGERRRRGVTREENIRLLAAELTGETERDGKHVE